MSCETTFSHLTYKSLESGKEKAGREAEKILEEVMVGNFPNVMKIYKPIGLRTQPTPSKGNTKTITVSHIISNCSKAVIKRKS